jgi:hypothetical protein
MPSSIIHDGQTIYRPGTYVVVNDQLSTPADLTGGNIAVIGDFPIFEYNTMNTFSAVEGYQYLTRSVQLEDEYSYAQLGRLAFKSLATASGDAKPDSVTFVNVRNNSQASYSNKGLSIKSKLWGPVGNRLKVAIFDDPDNANRYAVQIYDNGVAIEDEYFPNIGSGEIGKIEYDLAGAASPKYTAASVEVTAEDLEIVVEKTAANADVIAVGAGTGLFAVDFEELPTDGIVKFKTSGNLTNEHAVTIAGVDADGDLTTETIDMFANGSDASGDETNVVFESTKSWLRIDTVTVDDNTNFVGDFTVSVYYRKTPLADIEDLSEFLADVSRQDADFKTEGPASVVSGDQLDRLAVASITNTEVSFSKDLYDVYYLGLAASRYVFTELISNEKFDVTDATGVRLTGGNATTLSSSDWKAALQTILFKNINIVVPATSDISIQELVRDHCKEAASKAGLERNAWVGTTADISVSNAFSQYVRVLNDRNVAVVCQGVKVDKQADGTFEEPWFLALAMACVQASTPIAEPLTRKQLEVHSMLSDAIDPENEANDAIRQGLVLVTSTRGPHRIERSVTSYLKNPEHPVYTEVSANESLNTCIREVRRVVDAVVGSKATASNLQRVVSLATSTMQRLRRDRIIANFRNVEASLQGDRVSLSFDVAAMEPLNFITVTANIGQF